MSDDAFMTKIINNSFFSKGKLYCTRTDSQNSLSNRIKRRVKYPVHVKFLSSHISSFLEL